MLLYVLCLDTKNQKSRPLKTEIEILRVTTQISETRPLALQRAQTA